LQLPAAPELSGASPQGRWNAVSLAFLGDAVWEVRSCWTAAAAAPIC
jgi:23S rRNA maturation mini-RNase III